MLQAPLEHQHHMTDKLSCASTKCESKLGVASDRNRPKQTCTDTQTQIFRQEVEARTWRRQLATCVPVCTTTLNQESSTMTAPGSMASTSRRTACGPSTSHVYRQRRGCSMSTQLLTGSLRTCAAASQRSSARHKGCLHVHCGVYFAVLHLLQQPCSQMRFQPRKRSELQPWKARCLLRDSRAHQTPYLQYTLLQWHADVFPAHREHRQSFLQLP